MSDAKIASPLMENKPIKEENTMMTLIGKKITREEFLRLKENMIVIDNAILYYDESSQRLEATVFENDERTQKILSYNGLQ